MFPGEEKKLGIIISIDVPEDIEEIKLRPDITVCPNFIRQMA
ncbi:MAG: hypothetical protein R2741_12075 [Methanolobus sp.]